MSDQDDGREPGSESFPPVEPPGYPQPVVPGQPVLPGQFPPVGPYPPPPPGYWPAGMPPPRPRRSRRWWWIGGATFVVVALLVAGIVILKGRNDNGGADNPRAAVLEFLAAAENNDAFAAANLLDPTERSGVTTVLDNAHDTAEDASYQKGGGRNGLLQGVTVAVDDVQTSVTDLRDDLARVTFTGGRITLAFDPAQANAGVRDLVRDKDSREHTWTTGDLESRSRSGESQPPAVMTVKRSGRWYVSLVYSYLDALARDQDRPPVDPGPIDTASYDSPEAAAQGFLDGLIATVSSAKIMPVAKTLSPEAGALLATYRPMLEHGMKPQQIEVVGTPKFSTENTSGNSATVKIDDLTLESTDDNGDTDRVRFHGDCITTEHRTRCGENGTNPSDSLILSPRSSGFTATRDRTGWHLDPVATYLNGLADAVRDASKEEVALLLAEAFGAPKAFLRLDAHDTLNVGDSTTVTLAQSGGQGLGFAVIDMPVNSGDRLRIRVQATGERNDDASYREVWWMVVGETGKLASSSSYLDDYSTGGFSAPGSETTKIVLWGPPDERVTVEVSSRGS